MELVFLLSEKEVTNKRHAKMNLMLDWNQKYHCGFIVNISIYISVSTPISKEVYIK